MKPYKEVTENNVIVRTFSKDVESEELVWHRDRKDRVVKITKSEGWKFQYDDDIPFELNSGDTIIIPKETFHRILKGSGDLVIEIEEFE